jgi:hypothetical protein
MAKIAPGYYPNGKGQNQWYDGSGWVPDKFQDPAEAEAQNAATAADAAARKPLYAFTSHNEGKNAKVEIWADRLEWERKSMNAFKVLTGAGFVTGFRNKNTDMLPMRSITSVTAKKGIGINTVITIHSAAGELDFRVGHKEADKIRGLLNRLILDAGKTTVVVQQAAEAQAPDIPAQLGKLKDLLDAGVLTQEEFDAKKTELLARL